MDFDTLKNLDIKALSPEQIDAAEKRYNELNGDGN
jgi:hypothetical protein